MGSEILADAGRPPRVDILADAGRQPRVEVRLSGTFAVICDGAELADAQIGSRKSRLLLKLLSVCRPALVTTDQIAEVLWDGAPPAGADRNIASLISRLRAVLGAGVIQGGRAGYRLGDESAVSVDLDMAARLCDQAERKLPAQPAAARAAAERACDLLSAGIAIADEPYASWAEPARDESRSLLRRARLAAADAALETGDPAIAVRYAEAAMIADGLDEAAHRVYMSATTAAGEQARALLAFAALRERLRAELGSEPAPQTRDLHLAILREEADQPGRNVTRPGQAAAARSPGRTARSRPDLTGRGPELEAVRMAWSRAAGRVPGLVLIAGEAGIGKTTLAEFMAAEAAEDGATVLRSRCYETERSLFLQPIVEALTPAVARMAAARLRDMLGPRADAAAALIPAVADLLGPAPLGRGSVEMERRRAFEAVTSLLGGLAERGPVLLLVDDLHYAGQSTVELLHFLGRHVTGARLLTMVMVRAEHVTEIGTALDPVAVRIDLGPLAPAAVEQLAREAGQGTHVADILQRTRGHTLFVVEVLRALRGGDDGVPSSLREAVQARVRRAGGPIEALLRAASVLGAAVDPLNLAALLGLAPAAALELCEQALQARLLYISGRHYEFGNDLIREVLYATTPEPTRLAYHRQAADLLTAQPEAVALHAAAVGDWPRAARALLVAALEAMRRYAASDAAALATGSLAAAERGDLAEVGVRALIARGRAGELAGTRVAAFSDFTEAAARARAIGDRRQEMHALRELGGDVPVSLGQQIAFCESNLASALQIAQSLGDRASEADLLSRLAVVATNRLHLDTALDLGLRAVAAGRAAADDQALAVGLDGLKSAAHCLGDMQRLGAVLAELDPLLRRQGDLFRLQWAELESASLAIALADWDTAEARVRAAIETNRRSGYPHWASWFSAHLSLVARLRGRGADAVNLGRRAVELADQHEHGWCRALTRATLSTALLLTGSAAEVPELLEIGLAAAERDGAEGFVLRCLAPLAEVTGSAELLARASGMLDRAAGSTGAWMPGYEVYLSVARSWLSRREAERARSVLKPLLAVAERTPWIPQLAEALVVDGNALIGAGDRELATTQLERAGQLAREYGLPHVQRDAGAARRLLR